MSDPQDQAEQLDGDVLGEKPTDDTLPGVNDYADRRPMNVEDPSIQLGDGPDTPDDLALREWRETDDPAAAVDDNGGMRLTESEPDSPTLADSEKQSVATGYAESDPSAEEAALHTVDGPDDPAQPTVD